jgi:hypothetical protein
MSGRFNREIGFLSTVFKTMLFWIITAASEKSSANPGFTVSE